MSGSRRDLSTGGASGKALAAGAFGLLVAALAIAACAPGLSPKPTETTDGSTALPATNTQIPPSTETPTPIPVPTIAPGLESPLGADWPVIDLETAFSVGLLYTHSPKGVVNVIGSADADHLVLITTDCVVLLAAEDLSPSSIMETEGFGDFVAATMDPRTLVLAFREGGVRLVEISSGAELHVFDVALHQLELSLDGALLAGASVDGELYIWNVESGELMHEMTLDGMANNLTFAPDGKTLAVEVVGGPFEGLEMWSVESGERMRRLEWTDRAGPLYFVRISPDWTTAAWVSRTTVLLMDIGSGEAKAVLAHEDFVGEAEFSPDSDVVVTTSAAEIDGALSGVASLWDGASGSKTSTLVHGDAAVLTAFSPDGSVLATATYDGVIRLWDVSSAEMIAELDGEQEQVFRLFFAWGGRLLVSASWDGTVRFWAVEQGSAE